MPTASGSLMPLDRLGRLDRSSAASVEGSTTPSPGRRSPDSRALQPSGQENAARGGVAGAALLVTERLGAYAELSKFGIVLLVLVSTGAGFMLSAPLGADFPWSQGLLVLAGVMLLSCGASALNQVQERRRDALMARTAGRPLPSGRLSHAQGLAFALLAVVAGALVLWWGVGRT